MAVTELQDALKVCANCEHYKEFISKEVTQTSRGIFRGYCSKCKRFGRKDGIYKADIVLTALKVVEKFSNSGKKATRVKQYYLTVENLISEKKTGKDIAEITGLGEKTVSRIKRAIKIYNFHQQGLSIDDIAIRLKMSVEDVRKIASELPDDKNFIKEDKKNDEDEV